MHINGGFRGFADSERRMISTYKKQAELLGARGDISCVYLPENATETIIPKFPKIYQSNLSQLAEVCWSLFK